MLRTNHRAAFTLVELLVIITIIVVLLALLAPAMDRAIYLADLTVCGSQLRSVSTSATAYAAANKRYYTYKQYTQATNEITSILTGFEGDDPDTGEDPADNRFRLRDTLGSLRILLCPLAPAKVDFDIAHPRGAYFQIYTSYMLFFGESYPGEPGLRKLGDRITYKGERYSILAGDLIWELPQDNWAYYAHPDSDAVMVPLSYQNGEWFGTSLAGSVTISVWHQYYKKRGYLDMNFTFVDNSVSRIDGIVPDDVPENPDLTRPAKLRDVSAFFWAEDIANRNRIPKG